MNAPVAPAEVVAVCVGPGGIPKFPQSRARVTHQGLEGDRHAHPLFHGGPDKAVCLFSEELYQAVEAVGLPRLSPGAVGENLTLKGVDLQALRPGDRLRVGEVTLEITTARSPCRTLDALHPRMKATLAAGRPRRWPGRWLGSGDAPPPPPPGPGWYARVLSEGVVAPGDSVRVIRAGGTGGVG